MLTKRHKRWRRSLSKDLDLILLHFETFIKSKGSVNHFSRMTPELMEHCLSVMKSINHFNGRYKNWLKANVKNPEKFLSHEV